MSCTCGGTTTTSGLIRTLSRAITTTHLLRRGAAQPFSANRLLSTTTPRQSTLPVTITGTGTGTLQTITVPSKPYAFTADTYPLLGGADSAPSPVVYSLAALSACNQVTGHVVARDRGIQLGRWTVDVEGQLPTGALVEGKQEDPNWEGVKLSVRVQTDLRDEEKFREFVREVERRCPITALFRKSGLKWESVWVNERI
ncbi:hypothetical protein VTJ04DRAFT_10896 [Mycothermus thermophilus]|uniref:uncharacterized protein n=1 Tax=Humicola insolens TaxID=85995 RepID=UPI0037447052